MPSLESIGLLIVSIFLIVVSIRLISRRLADSEAPKEPGSRHGHPNVPSDMHQLPERDLEKLEALDKVEELQRKYDKDTDWKGRIPW